MKKFAIVLLLSISLGSATPAVAATNVFGQACDNNAASSSPACQANGSDPLTGPNGVIRKATRVVATISGIAAIIIFLIAAVMYITSGGDPGKVSSAKNTAVYTVIGLAVIMVAQVIIVFVLNEVK